MTPYGIDPSRVRANTPAAKRRRWLAQHVTAWIFAVVFIAGPVIIGSLIIEGIRP